MLSLKKRAEHQLPRRQKLIDDCPVQAVKWLSDNLQDAQLLVTLLGVLSNSINSICQQQPPPPAHVVACLTGNVLPMTAVLKQTVEALAGESHESLSFLTKVGIMHSAHSLHLVSAEQTQEMGRSVCKRLAGKHYDAIVTNEHDILKMHGA